MSSSGRARLEKAFWDLHARGWDDMRSQAASRVRFAGVADILADRIAGGSKVVDLGCGAGHLAVELAARGFSVTGIDLSSAMLRRAQSRAQAEKVNITFRQADLSRAFPSDLGTFDGAACLGVLQVIPDPTRFIRSVAAILAPGGSFLLQLPTPDAGGENRPTPTALFDRVIERIKLLLARVPGLVHFHGPEHLSSILSDAGFSSTEVHPLEHAVTLVAVRN